MMECEALALLALGALTTRDVREVREALTLFDSGRLRHEIGVKSERR
jgi:hypothetical protein